MRRDQIRDRGDDSRAGFTLLELALALLLVTIISLSVGETFLKFSHAFSSLTKLSYVTTRGTVVMDRIISEMVSGRFATLDPPIPQQSAWIRFERVVDVVDGSPVYGDPVQIDLVPMESSINDGVDNNGNGLIDEGGIRIWEDADPQGSRPGPEDREVVVEATLTKDGLKFTRKGAVLVVEFTLQAVTERGRPPLLYRLESGVKMRNNT